MTDVDAGALWRALGDEADRGLDDYLRSCALRDQEVRRAGIAAGSARTDVLTDLSADSLDRLKVALLMSELTAVYLEPSSDSIVFAGAGKAHWPTEFRLPVEAISEYRILCRDGFLQARGAHVIRSDETARRFLHEVAPLIRAGALVVRAIPCMEAEVALPDGRTGKHMLPVNPNKTGWEFDGEFFGSDSVQLRDAPESGTATESIGTFCVPMVSGVSFKTLAQILADEADCVAAQRAAIGQLVNNVKDSPNKARQIIGDVVQPSFDRLERRLKDLTQFHALRTTATTVSSFAVGLAVASEGFPTIAFAGLGGTLLTYCLHEVAAFRKARSELRNEPHYLLWRLHRRS